MTRSTQKTESSNGPDFKQIVKEKYGDIARVGSSCCSGSGCGDTAVGVDFTEKYQNLDGYLPEADLGLGCGLPTKYAGISQGMTVVDLGSGAGNDVFVARSLVGPSGRVVGLDMTQDMVDLARTNARKLGAANVEFLLGEIENMPLEDSLADVVVSNCVLNLVPDKTRAFEEIHRVLNPGGRFCISDIVLHGTLPDRLAADAALYVGCVAGALQETEYLAAIEQAGFQDVEVKQSREVDLPDDMLVQSLTEDGAREYRESGVGIHSITVTGRKAK